MSDLTHCNKCVLQSIKNDWKGTGAIITTAMVGGWYQAVAKINGNIHPLGYSFMAIGDHCECSGVLANRPPRHTKWTWVDKGGKVHYIPTMDEGHARNIMKMLERRRRDLALEIKTIESGPLATLTERFKEDDA